MNEYEENTWPRELVALDQQILNTFSGLEQGYAAAFSEGGEPTKKWLKENADAISSITRDIVAHTHTARQQHWREECARLGIPVEIPATKVTDAKAPEPPFGGATATDAKPPDPPFGGSQTITANDVGDVKKVLGGI